MLVVYWYIPVQYSNCWFTAVLKRRQHRPPSVPPTTRLMGGGRRRRGGGGGRGIDRSSLPRAGTHGIFFRLRTFRLFFIFCCCYCTYSTSVVVVAAAPLRYRTGARAVFECFLLFLLSSFFSSRASESTYSS